jgi:hypothetical protein
MSVWGMGAKNRPNTLKTAKGDKLTVLSYEKQE